MENVYSQIALKAEIDRLQRSGNYLNAANAYLNSNLDAKNVELRYIKLCLYGVLSSYMMYDPVLNRSISRELELNVTPFTVLVKEDPGYSKKAQAVISVLYYCVKNRSFNYALLPNANHDEISVTESLREWLEGNSCTIINGDKKTEKIFSAVMVLLYDKMLSATVELFHDGPIVTTGYTIYDFGSYYSAEANRKYTSSFQKIGAMRLKCIEDRRRQYEERRSLWNKKISGSKLSENPNTFLFGTYDLNELNAFLAEFDFKLYDISTKYYANYDCEFHFLSRFSSIKQLFYIVTNNDEALEKEEATYRKWPFEAIVKSLVLFTLKCIPLAVIMAVSASLLKEDALPIIIICGLICAWFTTPIHNRHKEKKKRKTYSILTL